MKTHIVLVHERRKPFKCDICNAKFLIISHDEETFFSSPFLYLNNITATSQVKFFHLYILLKKKHVFRDFVLNNYI